MDMQVVKWANDLGLAIMFVLTFVTGLFKWTLFMRTLGLTDIVFPVALMSDIHDWAGLLMGFFVVAHLYMNRAWILSMTKHIFR
jgi:hypothetical protein